ncbi:hypothetical protein POUND7_020053 [Theobroma cacao]
MSASAMHHLHITAAFLFVLLVTIFLSIQAPVCLGSDYEKFAGCNQTFHCGIIENISYPFRQRGSPEYCGQPGFELFCEDGKPMITIMSQSYQILEFNMSLKALTVARTDYLYSLCPKHLVNTSLGLGPFHSAWNNKQITLYYGCRSPVANQSTELSDRQFHCTINGTDVLGYFAIPPALGNLSATVSDALASCRSSVIVPAFASVVQYLEYNSNSTNLNVALANGFGLEWTIANDSPGSSDGINLKLKLIIGLAVAAATIIVAGVVVVTFRLKNISLSRGMFMNFNQGKRNDRERIEAFILHYGMMVLEMFGEKKDVHIEGSETSEMNFPLQIYEHLEQGADLNLKGITVDDEEITRKMIIVSLWCIQTNPSDRPSMTKVLEMLQGSIQSLGKPPRPLLYSPARSPQNSSTKTLFSQTFVMDNSQSEFF